MYILFFTLTNITGFFSVSQTTVYALTAAASSTPPTPSTPPGSPTASTPAAPPPSSPSPSTSSTLRRKPSATSPSPPARRTATPSPYPPPPQAAAAAYFLRTFTVYDNYDGKSHSPSFDVSVRGTLVFQWRSPWSEPVSRSGAYSDLFFHHDEPAVDLCFYSIATDSPVIASLELYQIDANAYPFDHPQNSTNFVLINYGRFSSGSGQWGPGFSNDTDFFGRSWISDADFRQQTISTANGASIKAISAIKNVANVEKSPNYFPEKLYQTAIMAAGHNGGGGGVLEYELTVDAKMDYLLWFHFAEIDVSVTRAGQRVFDVLVNDESVRRVDVFKEVGGFAAYDWSFVVRNLSSTTLSVRLEPVVGAPVICGLENYAIVPVDLRTEPNQVVAMRALKASLDVPDRMGWNGDPCAPTTWDAWEGVTCHPSKDEAYLVVSQIDLGSQGLKGLSVIKLPSCLTWSACKYQHLISYSFVHFY
ncbi:probable LRR receptor-like serine/threonine-protein kinase at1g51880 [Phtheirospermum japonicum]|uniref:Probable LRR receptor-like serine/threonine-protein kinase at1g51880 n=1 Tax=Phtheirospermum japonicum TaxID=374723 RepID=A0A830CBR0_9LAMI|nr:probable LRR receptor-like serine/threonine-protein kinase at1g51880 [Phtheirospermum japonicum]